MAATGTSTSARARRVLTSADGADAARAQRRTLRRPPPGLLAGLAATAFYVAFAAFISWPLVLHMSDRVYGGGGDLWGVLAQWRELAGHNPFVPGRMTDLAAPDGLQVQYSLNVATWPSTLILWSFSTAFDEKVAGNVFVLSGYVLSGLSMYLLALRLTGRRAVAFIAGFAFAFTPYFAIKGAGHWHYVHGWPLVLTAWAMLRLNEKPTLRSGLFAGAAVAFGMSFTPYYVLFCGVMMATFLLVGLVVAWRRKGVRAYLLPAAASCAVVIATLGFYLAVASTDENAPVREGTLAQVWYGQPLQYLIPTANSPLVGDWAAEYRMEQWGSSAENTVYVGISVLLLALVGLVLLVRRIRRGEAHPAMLAFPAIVIAALAFSTAPRWNVLGREIHTLVGLVYELSTAWRIFIRFVEVVFVGLTVLAALGIAAMTDRLKGGVRYAALAAIFGIIVLDFWPKGPDEPTSEPPRPAVYEQLAKLPPGLTAEYPLTPAEIPSYDGMLLQDVHGHPVVNGYLSGSDEEQRALQLAQLRAPDAAPKLATAGVKYVIVPDGADVGGGPFLPVERIPGLTPILAGDGRQIFEVTAKPLDTFWYWGTNVQGPEGTPPTQWITADRARLHVNASCEKCRARIDLRVTSFGKPRDVTLTGGGERVTVKAVPGGEARLILDMPYFERSTKVLLTTSPGAQEIGNGDPRTYGAGITATGVYTSPAG